MRRFWSSKCASRARVRRERFTRYFKIRIRLTAALRVFLRRTHRYVAPPPPPRERPAPRPRAAAAAARRGSRGLGVVHDRSERRRRRRRPRGAQAHAATSQCQMMARTQAAIRAIERRRRTARRLVDLAWVARQNKSAGSEHRERATGCGADKWSTWRAARATSGRLLTPLTSMLGRRRPAARGLPPSCRPAAKRDKSRHHRLCRRRYRRERRSLGGAAATKGDRSPACT